MRNTTTLAWRAHLRPIFSVTSNLSVSARSPGDEKHTQKANDGTEESTSLEGSSDVTRDISRVLRLDVEVTLEAIASNGSADKSRVITEPIIVNTQTSRFSE